MILTLYSLGNYNESILQAKERELMGDYTTPVRVPVHMNDLIVLDIVGMILSISIAMRAETTCKLNVFVALLCGWAYVLVFVLTQILTTILSAKKLIS